MSCININRYGRKKILLLVVSMFMLATLYAENPLDSIVSFREADYPDYVITLPEKRIDSVFYYANTSIVPVIFKVNRYRLFNNEQLDSIANVLCQILQDTTMRLAYVWIGGSASPEGPSKWNYQLGDYRSRALADFLRQKTGIQEDKLKAKNLWEDWYSFESALKNGAEIPNKQEVLDILEKESDNEQRKKRIKGLDNGRTWQRIVRDIFPPFRNARMAIVCHERPELLPSLPVGFELQEFCLPGLAPLVLPLYSRPEPKEWIIAVKTNLFFIAALTSNIGMEVSPWSHWSLDIPVWYSPYNISSTRKLRLLAAQPEIRWWPKHAMTGHFIGLHTHIAGFNVAINNHARYQDPNHALWGLGVSYGYTIHLGTTGKWALDFNIGAGFAEYSYDAYRNWKNGPKFHSGSEWYWGITRMGISISYKWYKQRKSRR